MRFSGLKLPQSICQWTQFWASRDFKKNSKFLTWIGRSLHFAKFQFITHESIKGKQPISHELSRES